MPLSSGTRLGPYEIGAPLGAGGMGEVYRARDTRLKRDAAIKVLPAEFAADPDRLSRFRREAELLATLSHPNIAIVHGLEEMDGIVAIAMELVDGQSLEQKLEAARDSGFGLAESLRIARQIGDALEAAHDKAIVHRDLKPGNIMLTHDGQVKVLDFGLAKIEERPGAPSGLTHSPTLTFAGTQAGLILGTASYMSPEQAKGRIADKRSDVWAFGCVLYEMLTGRRAFDGEDITEIIASVVKTDPDWRAFPADVPPHIQTIVRRCLHKDRKARIPDMAVVRFLLDDAAGAATVPSAPIAATRSRADDGIAHRLVSAESGGVYARSGHLLFIRQGTLLAQEFDAKTLTLSGETFSVAERVQTGVPPGFVSFSISDGGVLAFGTSTGGGGASVQLTWLDRQGKKLGTVGTPQDIRGVDLSPDGTRLAAHRHALGVRGDIWITDLARGATSRFTYDEAQENASPVWSPDGATIAFSSRRAGKSGVYRKSAYGSSQEELLVEQIAEVAPNGWSPDGRSLVYDAANTTGPALWMLPLTGDRRPVRLLSGRFAERYGQVSRDGSWIAYASSESGRSEIYVQPFRSGAGKSTISTGGGIAPRWRGDGRELFYLTAQGSRLLAVDIRADGSRLEAGTPKQLFETAIVNSGHPAPYHPYAVSADGQRFLIPLPVSMGDEDAAPVVVVTNWLAAIKK